MGAQLTHSLFAIAKFLFLDEKVATLPPGSLNWSASIADGRRKIVPSSDLLEDCYTSDGTTTSDAGSDVVVGRRTTAARLRTRDDEGGRFWSSTSVDKESLKTPDSLLTSELLDDSIFDGELDLIGLSPNRQRWRSLNPIKNSMSDCCLK